MNSFPVPTYFSITWHTNTISTSCLQKILDRLPWKLRGELRKEIPPKQGQVPLTAKHNQKCQWCTMRVILSYFKPSQFLHSQTACYELRRKDKLRLVSCPVCLNNHTMRISGITKNSKPKPMKTKTSRAVQPVEKFKQIYTTNSRKRGSVHSLYMYVIQDAAGKYRANTETKTLCSAFASAKTAVLMG